MPPVASEESAIAFGLPAAEAERAVAFARSFQIQERAFWMQRDLDQAAVNEVMCARQGELVALVEANNAEAGE